MLLDLGIYLVGVDILTPSPHPKVASNSPRPVAKSRPFWVIRRLWDRNWAECPSWLVDILPRQYVVNYKELRETHMGNYPKQ